MFNLSLWHGRHDPDQDMEDWGFDGPVIEGIVAIHTTYLSEIRITFKDLQHTRRAFIQTMWEEGLNNDELLISITDDMIYVPRRAAWYGDWSFYIPQQEDA